MSNLSFRERELVALGAALGSNCVPCVEFHVAEARKAGLTDQEIGDALELADKIRKVPAAKVLDAATAALGAPVAKPAGGCAPPAPGKPACC